MLNFEKLSLIVIARLLSKLGGSVRTIPLTGDEQDVITMAGEYIAINAEREQLESAAKMLRDAGWLVTSPDERSGIVNETWGVTTYTVAARRDRESRASVDQVHKAAHQWPVATPIHETAADGRAVWTQDFMRHFINQGF